MDVNNTTNIGTVKIVMLKGEAGNSIASIEKTATVGAVDTYTLTLTDGSTTSFEVTNGSDIETIEKTATVGLVDTYTITLTDGSTTTFEVTNGAAGNGIESIVKTSTAGLVDTYTITYTDGTTSTFDVTNGTGAAVDRTFDIATTDWVANTDTSTNTDYPYIAEITSSVYSASSRPIWQMQGVDTLPTSTEIEEMAKVSAAIFDTSGIVLYATEQPSVALVLSVKGE